MSAICGTVEFSALLRVSSTMTLPIGMEEPDANGLIRSCADNRHNVNILPESVIWHPTLCRGCENKELELLRSSRSVNRASFLTDRRGSLKFVMNFRKYTGMMTRLTAPGVLEKKILHMNLFHGDPVM